MQGSPSNENAAKRQFINIREVFEENSYLTTLDALERKGKKRVKVVRPDQILAMIQQAVDRVVAQAQESELEQPSKLVKRSEAEFQRIMAEQQAAAPAAPGNAEMEAEIAALREEMNSLRAENATLRRMSDGKAGVAVNDPELEKQITQLQKELKESDSELEELRERLEQAQSGGSSEDLKRAREKHNAAIEAAEQAIDRARDRARKAEQDYEEVRRSLVERDDRLRRLESELQEARSKGTGVADQALAELEAEQERHQAAQAELEELRGLLTFQQERMTELEEQISTQDAGDSDLQQQVAEAVRRAEQLEASLQEAQQAVQTRDERLHEIDQELSGVRSGNMEELAGLRSEVEALREGIRRAEELRAQAAQRLGEREEELLRVTEELEELRAKKADETTELKTERNRLQEQLRQLEAAGSSPDAIQKLQKAHAEELENLQTAAEAERSSLRQEADGRVRELEGKLAQLEAERAHMYENVETVHKDAQKRADQLETELRTARENLTHKSEELATLRGENSSLRERLGQMEETAAQLPSPDALKQMLADQFEAIRGELAKRPAAGGAVGSGRGSAEDVKLALDALFVHGEEMESNIESVGVKSSKGASILDNLRRMKSLRQKDDTES
ncbi:MAG: hypothetical protein RL885_28825 [Planctomycetota bacterium]